MRTISTYLNISLIEVKGQGKLSGDTLVKVNGQLITQNEEIQGTAELGEVTAVERALQRAVELGHTEIVFTK